MKVDDLWPDVVPLDTDLIGLYIYPAYMVAYAKANPGFNVRLLTYMFFELMIAYEAELDKEGDSYSSRLVVRSKNFIKFTESQGTKEASCINTQIILDVTTPGFNLGLTRSMAKYIEELFVLNDVIIKVEERDDAIFINSSIFLGFEIVLK